MRGGRPGVRAVMRAGALALASVVASLPLGAQQATFRTAVDVVAVDVQVVDRDGNPLSTLGRGDFEVTIDGRKRTIVSATFVASAPAAPTLSIQPVGPGPTASNVWPAANGAPGRTFILAVDVGSFDAGENARVMQATRGFVA